MSKSDQRRASTAANTSEAGEEIDRYEVILEVAARLFAAEGYTRTPLEAIAKEVGIHKATLYYYFSSKEEILEICLKRASADVELALRHLANHREPVVERLHYFFNSFVVAQSGLFGSCIAAVGSESLEHAPAAAIRDFNHSLEAAVAKVIAEGNSSGELRPCDPQLVARLLFGAFHWLPRWYRPGRGHSLGMIARFFVTSACDGLGGEKRDLLPLGVTEAPAVPAQKTDRRAEIVLLATRCFAAKGYDAASIGDIAQAVGLQKPSLYHYFSSKSAILAECVRLAHADMAEVISSLEEDSRAYELRLTDFLRRLMRGQNSEIGAYLYMVRDDQLPPESREEAQNFRRRLTQAMRKLLDEGVELGYLRGLDAPLTGAYILGVTNGLPRWHPPGKDGITEEMISLILDQLIYGFSPKTA